MGKIVTNKNTVSRKSRARRRKRGSLSIPEDLKIFLERNPIQYEVTDEERIKEIRKEACNYYVTMPERFVLEPLPGNLFIRVGYLRKNTRQIGVDIKKPSRVWREGDSLYVMDRKKIICLCFTDSNALKYIFDH